MPQSVHNNEETPIGGDMEYDQVAADQASHVVPTPVSVGLQDTPLNCIGLPVTPLVYEDPNNPVY